MSVFAAFHSHAPAPALDHPGHRLRAAFARIVERLTASPLDNSVLHAMGAPRTTTRPAGLHAHWHPVRRPDGTTGLEADWHTGN
ncbi:hypothetical protein [Streptomyces sp. NRRL WC-3742]|uniref:hypothetical protein n=1 Tax=Streptomyces sp. NRRL WC-3742 TaxID=1463934 RepID=UPI00055E743F|nr:hypothetical protein [Streptomyces sp. NRRL WC-3742]